MSASRCPHDGLHLIAAEEHDKSPKDPLLGTTIGGKYPILGIVGVGGMGTVYRSVQPMVDREVAIKVLRQDLDQADDTARQRFLREAKAIARVSHPAIVTLHDFGVDPDGQAYMVQELVRGMTLARTLRSRKTGFSETLDIALETLEALGAAHERGLVHRDLKPENIMLLHTPAGRHRVKVLDFGLAWLASESPAGPRLTQIGMVFGTPEYMAPEQAMGQGADARADLYALGIILFQGLAGHLPYEFEQRILVLQAQVSSPIPDLPEGVDDRLAAVVRRALEKSPGDRFPNATAMAEALQEARRDIEERKTYQRSVEQAVEEHEDPTVPMSMERVATADAPTEEASYDLETTLVQPRTLPAARQRRARDPTLKGRPGLPPDPDPSRPPVEVRLPTPAEAETAPMPSLPDQIPQNLRPIVTVRLRSRRTWPTVALAVGVAAAALAALLVALTTGGACGS